MTISFQLTVVSIYSLKLGRKKKVHQYSNIVYLIFEILFFIMAWVIKGKCFLYKKRTLTEEIWTIDVRKKTEKERGKKKATGNELSEYYSPSGNIVGNKD